MQSFRAQLTAASTEEPVETWPATRWNGILDDFCVWLNETYGEFLVASLAESAAPRVHHIKVWPRGQRNMQSILLSAHLTEDSARILGTETPELKTEETFRTYLVDIVRSPAFRESLEGLKEIACQPVEGALRVGASWNTPLLLADVVVEVPPEQQHQLASAAEATSPWHIERLYVLPSSGTRGGRYSRDTRPMWLVAGGYVLSIDDGSDAQEPDGRIRLSGTPLRPRER